MASAASPPVTDRVQAFRNTDRLNRIRYRLRLYEKIVWHSLGVVPAQELVRTQFPFWMADPVVPPMLSVELTNHCNLRCGYCTNPTSQRARGLMSDATFARLERELQSGGVWFVALCGNGEPTLHPRFPDYVRRLARYVPNVSVTSNWQRIEDETAIASLKNAREINVSVDGSSLPVYERRRSGGSFPRLLENLRRLRELKRATGSRALINIRVMLGTEDRPYEEQTLRFWRSYGDVVSKQYILDLGTGTPDAFFPVAEGRCSLTLRKLDVHWNGVVNLCGYSWLQIGDPEGVVLGNIRDTTLAAMWNCDLIRQYREGHRYRRDDLIPICRGCPGRT
jgi:MoaA/NifB/PqqE/SkfB family radical SAM enzyme